MKHTAHDTHDWPATIAEGNEESVLPNSHINIKVYVSGSSNGEIDICTDEETLHEK